MKIKRLLAVGLCCVLAIPFLGCKDKNGTKVEENTVNVMMVSAGYGKGFVEDVAEAFNTVYKEKGYKINILEPRSNFQGTAALNEMRLGNETGYDLIITDGVSVQQATDAEFGVCVESLNDVYDSTPINFDGTEGDKKISELYNKNNDWRYKIGDTYWSLPYSESARGLVCNTKVLSSYGITELPITTDELFNDFNLIYNGANGKAGMRPITWGGSNAFGYALPPFYTHIAQLMGKDAYDEFFKMNYLLNDDGTIKSDGYNFVDNEAIKTAIELIMQEFDVAYSVAGSVTQKHTNAHAQIITGKTAFMFNGEFFFNEVKTSFPKYLKDVRFAAMPVATQLGVNLKLDGTGTNRDKCDKILSYIVKGVDDGTALTDIKTAAEAQFGVTLTSEQVERVAEARHTGNTSTAPMYVIKDSKNAELAKLFLRMMMSEDAAKAYAKYGMIHPLFSTAEVDSEYQFIKDAYKVDSLAQYSTTSTLYPNSVRAKTNMFIIPPYNALFPVTFKDEMGAVNNPSERNYSLLASTTFNKIKQNVKDNWSTLVANGGYKVGK